MKKIIIIIIGLSIFSTNSFSQTKNIYKVVYEADKNGNTISGSLDELLEYVQNGNPIRVGWYLTLILPNKEKTEMQHWTDAGFITTLEGHVFAQVRGIFQQSPSPSLTELPSVSFVTNIPNSWVAIIGTTGVMQQKFIRAPEIVSLMKQKGMTDKQIDNFFKNQETKKVRTKWSISLN